MVRMLPPPLGNGVPQLPWLPPLAALAMFASLGLSDCIPAVFNWLATGRWHHGGFFWPTLISSIPVICCLAYVSKRAGTTIADVFGLKHVCAGGVLISGVSLFLCETILAIATGVLLDSLGMYTKSEMTGHETAMTNWSLFFAYTDRTIWAPTLEELAFRGPIYISLRTRLGVVSSCVVTAALFAFSHPIESLDQGLVLFVPAILSSLWYERTRTLWPNIISHALTNFL